MMRSSGRTRACATSSASGSSNWASGRAWRISSGSEPPPDTDHPGRSSRGRTTAEKGGHRGRLHRFGICRRVTSGGVAEVEVQQLRRVLAMGFQRVLKLAQGLRLDLPPPLLAHAEALAGSEGPPYEL